MRARAPSPPAAAQPQEPPQPAARSQPAEPSAEAAGRPRQSRRRWGLAALGLALLIVFDWSRPPSRQVSAGLELAAIGRYQAWISPWLQRGGVRCRFTPSCSHYAAAVVARDGFAVGNLRALRRLVRCGPWTNAGTVDPP